MPASSTGVPNTRLPRGARQSNTTCATTGRCSRRLYRDAPGRPSYQVGVRYLLVTDRVELFASGGSRLGDRGDTWFAKFGARIQTWKLF